MMEPEKRIYVFADWISLESPHLMGILTVRYLKGKEVFSFEYSDDWLASGNAISLDPDLSFFSGFQHLRDDKKNFGIFLDSSPDRWGRVLMTRREILLAKEEKRKTKKLFESDYLLGIYDPLRMGALRFKTDIDGDFLDNNLKSSAPPWASIRELEHASLEYERAIENDDPRLLQWLNVLYAPGSSLGGARPKANVQHADGSLWIAKFPSKNDDYDMGAWEMLANSLAVKAGLNCAGAQIQKFNSKFHTYLSKRFDRNADGGRIHFASAMTLLGYADGAGADDGVSYLELTDFIIKHGSNTNGDLKELFRRIVFSICISNTDDHLRNHGFLLNDKGWALSPAYDINPNPDGRGLALNIDFNDNSLDLDLALNTAEFFRLDANEAKSIIDETKTVVSTWKQEAKRLNIPSSEIEWMEGAFSVVE